MSRSSPLGRLTPPVVFFYIFCLRFASAFAPVTWRDQTPPPQQQRRCGSSLLVDAVQPNGIRRYSQNSIATGDGDSYNNQPREAVAPDDDHRRHPRLASALESLLKGAIRFFLLSRCSSLTVAVAASSNRSLLRGNLDGLSVSVRDCDFRFGLLRLSRWDLHGTDLRFGYVPAFLALMPFLLWRVRSYFLLTIFGLMALKGTGLAANPVPRWKTLYARFSHRLGARPTHLNYSLALSNEDVAESTLLQLWLRSILRSLILNSVVGAAAAFGDATTASINEGGKSQGKNVPLLPSGSSTESNASADVRPASTNSGDSSQQGMLTSALLSATSFELKDASFSDGRVLFDAEAVISNEEQSQAEAVPAAGSAGEQQQSRLAFTIRTRLEPTALSELDVANQAGAATGNKSGGENNALAFTSPECRLCLTSFKAGSLLGKIIPDFVWIPFGMGVAVPFGESSCIHRAEVLKDDGRCRIDGSMTFFPPKALDSQSGGEGQNSSLVRQGS